MAISRLRLDFRRLPAHPSGVQGERSFPKRSVGQRPVRYQEETPMSRNDPLHSRLDRRDLLKITGAAGAALGARGFVTSERALARQDAGNAIIFGVGTDVDELDPRTTDTQEGYIVAANVYDCLVLYDLGAT